MQGVGRMQSLPFLASSLPLLSHLQLSIRAGLNSGHERKAHERSAQLMWGVSITIITNHLITDFPANF